MMLGFKVQMTTQVHTKLAKVGRRFDAGGCRNGQIGKLSPYFAGAVALALSSCSEACGIPGTAYIQCAYRYSDDMTPTRVVLKNASVTVSAFEIPKAYVALFDNEERSGIPNSITTGIFGVLVSVPGYLPIKIARRSNSDTEYAMVTLRPTVSGPLSHYSPEESPCRRLGIAASQYTGSSTYKWRTECDMFEFFYAGTNAWPRRITCIFHKIAKPVKCTFVVRLAENIVADVSVPHPRLSGSIDLSEQVGLAALNKICTFVACDNNALKLGDL
jgi:hypothetical protein